MITPRSVHRTPRRPSAGERVFSDERDNLWNASYGFVAGEWAVEFSCVTDVRQPTRALAVPDEAWPPELTETILRTWLARAPRVGPLA